MTVNSAFANALVIQVDLSDCSHSVLQVVGMLVRARRHGLVHFTGEMLYQGQDNDKIIMLLEMPAAVFPRLGLKTPKAPEEPQPDEPQPGTAGS